MRGASCRSGLGGGSLDGTRSSTSTCTWRLRAWWQEKLVGGMDSAWWRGGRGFFSKSEGGGSNPNASSSSQKLCLLAMGNMMCEERNDIGWEDWEIQGN